MRTKAFWLGVLDRAAKSGAQSLILLWTADAGLNVLAISWPNALGLAGGAVVLSVLTSIVSAPAGDEGTTALLPGAR